MSKPSGPWKEGREGALSLCYIGLDGEALGTVLRHHAAVGIRASIVCAEPTPELRTAADRNWELVAGAEDPELLNALSLLDNRSERGLFLTDASPVGSGGFLYHLSTQPGDLDAPGPDLSTPLPSHPASGGIEDLIKTGKRMMETGRGSIQRIDAAGLSRMGEEGHTRLLGWLGDHHDRIWGAPIRDIVLWS